MAPRGGPVGVLSRLGRDVERSLIRTRKGLRLAAATEPPPVGTTPKEVVWRRDKAQLWRYTGGTVRHAPPVVIVHSLVSRSYILDLRPGSSMVEHLKHAGFDVFMVDWGVPDELDAENTLETYCDEYLPRALAAACAVSGKDELTVAGYCLGGVLVALHAAGHPDAPVRNLVGMATPIDMDAMGDIVGPVRPGRLDPDDVIDETGNVPPDLLHGWFKLRFPTDQVAQYANLWENLHNDAFVEGYRAMARWAQDHVPFPGAAFRQVVDLMIRRNLLADGVLPLGGRDIQLADISSRVLNMMAERDTVVPVAASEPLTRLIGRRRVQELRLPAGHIAFAAGRQATRGTLPRLASWLAEQSDQIEEART
jgi:polyhydroxyalkanoate synthase